MIETYNNDDYQRNKKKNNMEDNDDVKNTSPKSIIMTGPNMGGKTYE
jgi:DNA mismatch repair ATPase MutS